MADSEPLPAAAPRGLFVTLDGPDGGGKTTQAAQLAAWLRAQGHSVVTCRDPGGTELGERLRAIVLDRETVRHGLRAETLLYMASRAQLVEEVIEPALARGQIVVSDRFLLANIAYQGCAGGLSADDVGRVGRIATGGLLPDLTIVLDVAPEVARARVGKARDRIEDRPPSYHALVREGFLEAVRQGEGNGCSYYPAAMVLVDASAGPEAVFARIQSEVERVLALGARS
jgi:dTMP kinase